MKKAVLVYTADANLMNDSKVLVGIFENKDAAIGALLPRLNEECDNNFEDHNYDDASKMFKDLLFQLDRYNQTQNLSENFMLEEQPVNELF